MSLRFRIHVEHNVAVFTCEGQVDDGQLIDSYGRYFTAEDWIPGLHQVADMRCAEVLFTASGLRKVDELGEAKSQVPFKTAILSDGDLGYGLGRMYEAFTADSSEQVRVFRDPKDAAEWLQIPLELLDRDG